MSGRDIAEAATRLVGSPFRLHGRDPATGLDCLGLALAALAATGRPADFVGDYALRMRSIDNLLDNAPRLGLAVAEGNWRGGDILLFGIGNLQHHLAIATGTGTIVHAHAGLGRVVCNPPPADWLTIGHWRLAD